MSTKTIRTSTLHREMSIEEFDNGYFYAADLKAFAREVGIPVGNFRKIELENLIRQFLRTGKVPDCKPVMPRKAGQACDKLTSDMVVANYVDDKKTKSFLLELVRAEAPGFGRKSGQWYWLNDWRRKKTDFRADPANAGIPEKDALKAWNWLEAQPGPKPKTYAEYRRLSFPETPDGQG